MSEPDNIDNNTLTEVAPEPWWDWRPVCAFIYLTICLVDFIAMPVMMYKINTDMTQELMADFSTPERYELLKHFSTKNYHPLTLYGGGLFHVSFGAILTGAAITKGLSGKAK